MKDNLKEIFQNVNDWLKFAEAKHAGLIVLNSGVIFGVLTVYKEYKNHLHWFCILTIFILIGISILLSLISFFPITRNFVSKKKHTDNPNLYFFGSLSLLDESRFKNELLKVEPNHQFNKFENDLINQILVNSSITSHKFILFKYAVISTTLGFTIPLLFILFKLLWH